MLDLDLQGPGKGRGPGEGSLQGRAQLLGAGGARARD